MKIVYTFLLVLAAFRCFAQTDSSAFETPLVLHTPTGDIDGTLTLPKGLSGCPLALILAGSGPTNRDGNNPVMQNNSLRMLAHALAGSGIASLRFDKRGLGGSRAAGKAEADLRFDDFVGDAQAWLELLAKDPRFTRLFVIGHSEGSLIGMMAAKGRAQAFVSLAGPGRPAAAVLREQLAAQPSLVKEAAYRILDSLEAGYPASQVPPYLAALFRPSVQPYLMSWFKYDPAKELALLHMPVLVLQGTTDMQVSEADARLLAKANTSAQLQIVPHMNHVLKNYAGTNRQENLATYSQPDLPLHPTMVAALVAFLQNVR